ncbi:MAG TPA: sugar ABC transporter substrate-binding protein [Solirubrobacteraceae bacterium]|nr:sugar ABC transporter substrate-binding protein [Solirubrobacteraceae bacterium]
MSKPIRIAFLPQGITSYTTAMVKGINSVATPAGGTVKMLSPNDDPATQLSQCETAISEGYDIILIQAVNHAAAIPCVEQAVAKGVVVIPTDQPIGSNPVSSAIQVPGVKAQVLGSALGVDANLTIQAVKMACSHFPPPCTIVQTESIPALFYSSFKVSDEQPRFKALGYKVIATPVIGNFDDAAGMKSAIQTILVKTPNIDVIVSDDDSSLQGAVQLKEQGKLPHTLIVGDGGSGPALAAIKAGDEFATTLSVPESTAAAATTKAIEILRGQPFGKPAETQLDLTKYPIVTKANVADVTAQW